MTRVAVVQLGAQDDTPVVDAVDAVVARLDRIEADLVTLPEIWTPGYFAFDRYAEAASTAPLIIERLSAAAARNGFVLHAGSIVESDDDRLYNTSLLFDATGERIGRYRKMHLFGYGSREQELLTPGAEVVTVDTEFGTMGLAVCYDLRFPELFRRMVDAGAVGFLVASAWPHPRVEAWKTMIAARAAENQAWLVATNGTGVATGAMLCGRSAVVDPWGTTIAGAGDDPVELHVDVDFGAAVAARDRFPALADRRLLSDGHPVLTLERRGERPLRFPVRRVVLAGYTGRDQDAVAVYIEKLAAEGVQPPDEIPSYFVTGADRLTTATHVDVLGERTSGEAEFVLLITGDEVYVAAGSDHTDRALEEVSIPAAKQAAPKIMSRRVWRLDEVIDHWDELVLESRTPRDADEPHQQAELAAMLPPDELLERVRERVGDDLDGTVVFGGTVAARTEGFVFHDSFSASISDPVRGESLELAYTVHDVGTGTACP